LYHPRVSEFFLASSCNGYIRYYNKVNTIDRKFKANHDTVAFIKRYNKLFKKYNRPRVILLSAIMETYIVQTSSGKTLEKRKACINYSDLVAPYNDHYKTLFPICAKYGIDSLSVDKNSSKNKE
jgi:hypothetical protein